MKKGLNEKNKKLLQNLGEKIRKLRIEMDLSQEELAYRAQLDRTYMTGIEKGERNISVTTLIKIAEALNIEINLVKLLNSKNK